MRQGWPCCSSDIVILRRGGPGKHDACGYPDLCGPTHCRCFRGWCWFQSLVLPSPLERPLLAVLRLPFCCKGDSPACSICRSPGLFQKLLFRISLTGLRRACIQAGHSRTAHKSGDICVQITLNRRGSSAFNLLQSLAPLCPLFPHQVRHGTSARE